MGVINSIIEQGLTDNEYIKNYTNGFSELSEHAKSKTPEWASKITGVKAEDIKKLALSIDGDIYLVGVATDYAGEYPDAPYIWKQNKLNQIEVVGTSNIEKYSINFELSN